MVVSSGARDFLHILPNPTNMLDLHQLLLIHLVQTMTRTGPPRHAKKKKISALDEKAERVQNLADKLQAKHGETFNRIQYKLWAEASDVKKHDSTELPPPGTIWGGTPKESKRTSVTQATSEAMNEAFTSMATSIVSAF